jgi:CHAT domain-containing protein/tetratricopeptide (TPR) repeat protein
MDKPRWLPAQTATKGLVLLWALGLFFNEGSRAFAQEDDPGLLAQQILQLYQHERYQQAIPLAEKLLAVTERTLGPDDPNTATALNDLAELYRVTGAYAKAEALFQQALQIYQKGLGPDHPYTASALNNLAELYRVTGAYAKAEALFQQALQITQRALGPDDPATATYLNNLAGLYLTMGAYARTEALYRQALQICRKALGPEHPDTATVLNNLAGLYDDMGAYGEAEPLLEQALQICRKALGPEHPDTARSLDNLALLYQRMGAYDKAEPLLEQALQICQKALGPEHPATAISLENLTLLKLDLGQVVQAKILVQESAKARLTILSKVLAFTSERQRLAYQDTLNPYSLFALLGGNDAELAAAVLRYKGIVLDSLIEDRLVAETSKTAQDRDLLARLGADKQQLSRLLLQTPNQPSGDINKAEALEHDKKAEALEHEVERLEGQMARHVAGLGRARQALDVTVEQVQAVIPRDSALIEYVWYWHYLPKGKGEPRYGAIVLTSSGPPHWVPLGNAKDVDAAVDRYRDLLHKPAKTGQPLTDDEKVELSATLEALHGQLWGPIECTLPPNIKRVILSPDGQLNFVSFATLLDPEERFLAEKYTVQYVASGRDLLREVQPANRTTAIVFANPEFILRSNPAIAQAGGAASSATAGALRGPEKRGIEKQTFPALKGTQKECDRLVKAFQGWHWSTEAFTGPKATKAALRQVHSPYLLHLATHGFFEPADQPDDAKAMQQQLTSLERSVTHSKFFQNPMHCSGLALAGARNTLEAWKRGEVPPVENDGIVTAEDVAALDLKGTWLVTLSACDTASGEAKAGEGVLGLRRGFVQAGAQHLLMTLWPISDEDTVRLMTDFYETARRPTDPPQALAEVQRHWLVVLRKKQGLAQAVLLAGAFIMSSQGKP